MLRVLSNSLMASDNSFDRLIALGRK